MSSKLAEHGNSGELRAIWAYKQDATLLILHYSFAMLHEHMTGQTPHKAPHMGPIQCAA